jgi:hypothetical protein
VPGPVPDPVPVSVPVSALQEGPWDSPPTKAHNRGPRAPAHCRDENKSNDSGESDERLSPEGLEERCHQGARGRRLRRRRWRRQLLSLLGRWRRQLLSLLGAGALEPTVPPTTNRCMGQAVRDGWRASKPAIYALPSIFLVMFNPPAALEPSLTPLAIV